MRYRSAKGIDGINSKSFENNIDENINIIYRKSHNGTYSLSKYKEKLFSKGPEKYPRVISIPTIRDKLALKALFEVLSSVYTDTSQSLHQIIAKISSIIKKGDFNSVIRLDVENFYPSIQHDILFKEIQKNIKKKEILHLLKSAVTQITVETSTNDSKTKSEKGVPQGLSISNILANIYLIPIDKKYANKENYEYFRFVDDILILCNREDSEKIQNDIREDFLNIGLSLHSGDEAEKTKVCEISEGFSYLGYKFKPDLISVRKKSVEKIRNSLIGTFTAFKYSKKPNLKLLEWTLNIRITGCIYNNSKYGWVFFFSQINDYKLLHSLDHFVRKQCERFNLDHNSLKLKKFNKTYYEITKNLSSTKYIPNFDLYTTKQKRRILKEIFGIKTKLMRKHQIEYQFNRRIYKNIRDLEKDLVRKS